MPVVSISLTSKILKSLGKVIEERGYFSRSEAIRDAIRGFIQDFNTEIRSNDPVFATIIIITEYERHDVEKKISKFRHVFNNLVIEDIHRHIGEKYCVEIFHNEGESSEI
jgi:CopG family nickel-responsive transcriptional regulator